MISFLILTSNVITSQDTIRVKKIGIHTNPLSLLSFFHGPNINIGIDYLITPKRTIYIEFGTHQPFMGFNSDWKNISGFFISYTGYST